MNSTINNTLFLFFVALTALAATTADTRLRGATDSIDEHRKLQKNGFNKAAMVNGYYPENNGFNGGNNKYKGGNKFNGNGGNKFNKGGNKFKGGNKYNGNVSFEEKGGYGGMNGYGGNNNNRPNNGFNMNMNNNMSF